MRTRLLAVLLLALLAFPTLAAVTGTVMNRDGQPIAGAKVTLLPLESAEARRARLVSKSPNLTPLVAGESDGKGNFKLETKEAMATLRIEAKGYAPISLAVERDDDTGAIPMRVAAPVTGTITAGGKPVAGATVAWIGSGSTEVVATTDEKGKYTVPDPAKWAARIVVHHPDFAVHDDSTARSQRPSPDAKLDGGVAVSGRVVGSDGQTGVAKAPVTIDGWPLAISGDDGAFAIAHAPKKWEILEARSGSTLAYRTPGASPLTLKLAPAASITGSVRDAKTQRPVAGAEVSLAPATRFGATASFSSTLTDAKGVFTIPLVRPGSYRLMGSHPAFSIPGATINIAAGQKQQKQLTAMELARISGTVVDEEKRPVAAANIRAHHVSTTDYFIGPRDVTVVRDFLSGPDGRFTVRTAGEAEMTVAATKKGFPEATSSAFRVASGERKSGVVLTIPSGIAVTGRVLDQQGKPVSGVMVSAAQSQGGPGGGMVFRRGITMGAPNDDEGEVRTSSDGAFTIRLKEGRYDIGFKREGFAGKSLRAVTVARAMLPLEVKLEPGAEIAGRVVRNGQGVEGVSLSAITPDSQAFDMSGPDGSFVLTDLLPGTVMVNIMGEQAFVQDMRSLTAPSRDVVIELPPGGRITGRVVEKGSRRPITSFQAGISGSRSGGGMVIELPPMLRSFTSEDGTFTLDNVPPGTVQVVAQAPGFTSGRAGGLIVEDGKTLADVEVALDTGVKLYGKITGPDGSPLSGATVRLDQGRGGGGRVMRFNPMDPVAVSDAGGEYSIDTLEAGEKTFSISHTTYLPQSKTVDLTGRETRLDVQLSAGQRVTGTVVTEAGAPVSDAAIRASSAAGSNKSTRTDANGNFSFEGLAPGRYNFTAQKSGYADGTLRDHDISTGAPVRVALKTGGVIYGRVSGLTESELASTSVSVRGPGGWAQAAVDSSGSYRLEGAPTGSVQVSAEVERGFSERKSSPRKTVEVQAGSSVQVDLEFNSASVVRGRVTRNGTALGNTMIVFEPKDSAVDTRASAMTDTAGNYSVSGLSDATYTVNVLDMRAMTPHSTTYEVRGGGTFDIDIRSVAVRGRVVDSANGDPIEGATVQLKPAGGSASQSMRMSRAVASNADGSFILDGVAAGQYTVGAEKEGYGRATTDVSVGETPPRDVELSLMKGSPLIVRVVDARDKHLLNATAVINDMQGRQVSEPSYRWGGGGSAEPLRYSLPPGQYRASISATGYAAVTVTVVAPGEQTVELTPGGTLIVRSKSSTSRQLRLLDAGGRIYSRPQNWDGLYRLDPAPGAVTMSNVAAGTYTIQALGANGAVTDSAQVVVMEGQVGYVDI